MKLRLLIIPGVILSAFLFIRSNGMQEVPSVHDLEGTSKFTIPGDVQPIIQKSCFGCHNQESKNDKAKAKLQFDLLEKMPKAKLVGALSKINEMASSGDMPPAPFLERFPNAKPTDEERQKLASWSKEAAGGMMKKKADAK
ncbi:MAG TPA: heme-binding domain-containing protein [Cyclobacteriaceae bacterium]|nr:heme-binding domain-containing protein [Cyclobacteriaceae bacterium]